MDFNGGKSVILLAVSRELAACSWDIAKVPQAPRRGQMKGDGDARGGGASSVLPQRG